MPTMKRKTPGIMRDVLANNINALMARVYVESDNKPRALAHDAGLSLSTVQRTISCECDASIDTRAP